MIGERLARARSVAGLSMQGLADHVGVSANMIKKYEHNQSMPTSGNLVKLAKALGVRSEYFFRPAKLELAGVEFRKRANTSASLLKKIQADVLDQAERWQELADLWPVFPIATFTDPLGNVGEVLNMEDIDALALKVRDAWGLGEHVIADFIDVLESHGILVIITSVDEGSKFDGLQAKIAGQPIIVISSNWPGDRQRFTLAHELGHLLLHNRLATGIDEERACNRFAGSFMIPADFLRQHFGAHRRRLELQELFLLKHEVGMSMLACIFRACDVGIITEQYRKSLIVDFSKRGWRTLEPGALYPKEQTRLFEQLVYRALGEGIIGESKAAELMGISLMSFHSQRAMESLDATAYQ